MFHHRSGRQCSHEEALEVGEVTVLGQPRVENDECIPVVIPVITIDKDPLNPIDPDRLRISILEQGGWALHQELLYDR